MTRTRLFIIANLLFLSAFTFGCERNKKVEEPKKKTKEFLHFQEMEVISAALVKKRRIKAVHAWVRTHKKGEKKEEHGGCIGSSHRFDRKGRLKEYHFHRVGSLNRYEYNPKGELIGEFWVSRLDGKREQILQADGSPPPPQPPPTWREAGIPPTLIRKVEDPCFNLNGIYKFRFNYARNGLVQDAKATLIDKEPGSIQNLYVQWKYEFY